MRRFYQWSNRTGTLRYRGNLLFNVLIFCWATLLCFLQLSRFICYSSYGCFDFWDSCLIWLIWFLIKKNIMWIRKLKSAECWWIVSTNWFFCLTNCRIQMKWSYALMEFYLLPFWQKHLCFLYSFLWSRLDNRANDLYRLLTIACSSLILHF